MGRAERHHRHPVERRRRCGGCRPTGLQPQESRPAIAAAFWRLASSAAATACLTLAKGEASRAAHLTFALAKG
jgi:hypothetical protein